MRLVCPSCEAKYEVPDDAIPDTGRDVQCANCGHGWFQMRNRPAPVPPSMPIVADRPRASAPDPLPAVPEVAPAEAAPVAVAEEEAAPPDAVAVPTRATDEKVLTILREEAEREAKARREKTRLIGSLPEPDPEPPQAARRKSAARKKEVEPEVAAAAAADVPPVAPETVASVEPPAVPEPTPPPPAPQPAPVAEAAPPPVAKPAPEIELKTAARRDLLPDVEEIKSTLEPTDEPEPEFVTGTYGEGEGREGRGAFRSGFLTVISAAILASSIYIAEAWLSAKVPALAGPLASYVSAVDELRLNLDGLMRQATLLISGEEG